MDRCPRRRKAGAARLARQRDSWQPIIGVPTELPQALFRRVPNSLLRGKCQQTLRHLSLRIPRMPRVAEQLLVRSGVEPAFSSMQLLLHRVTLVLLLHRVTLVQPLQQIGRSREEEALAMKTIKDIMVHPTRRRIHPKRRLSPRETLVSRVRIMLAGKAVTNTSRPVPTQLRRVAFRCHRGQCRRDLLLTLRPRTVELVGARSNSSNIISKVRTSLKTRKYRMMCSGSSHKV